MIDINIRFRISFSKEFSAEDSVPECAKYGSARGFIGRFEKGYAPICSLECSCFEYGKCGCAMAKYDEKLDEFLIGGKCPLYQKAMACLEHTKEIYKRIEMMEQL